MNPIADDEYEAIYYPFGGYDFNTIKLMNSLNLDLGFTTEIGPAKTIEGKEFILSCPGGIQITFGIINGEDLLILSDL
tara:strand:- start:4874 stop:5107 length:234 start_codon:yes stop_codon:yes gene_type:complete